MTLLAFLRHLVFAASLAALSAAVVRVCSGSASWTRRMTQGATSHPKGGGVGIVVAFLVGIYVLYSYVVLADRRPLFPGRDLAAAAIALVAFLDDLRDWPFTIKLAAQILAALAAVGSGLYVRAYSVPMSGRWISAGSAPSRPSPGSCSRPTR